MFKTGVELLQSVSLPSLLFAPLPNGLLRVWYRGMVEDFPPGILNPTTLRYFCHMAATDWINSRSVLKPLPRGRSFELEDNEDGGTNLLYCMETMNINPPHEPMYLGAHLTYYYEEHLIPCLIQGFTSIEKHEVDELLLIDGVRLFDPHRIDYYVNV
ncbi:MAG: hypothetical protein KGI54_13240 [Pseudomonadota bacterium]|nr:hypothetical protein [Pseudomonadota bacterium]